MHGMENRKRDDVVAVEKEEEARRKNDLIVMINPLQHLTPGRLPFLSLLHADLKSKTEREGEHAVYRV